MKTFFLTLVFGLMTIGTMNASENPHKNKTTLDSIESNSIAGLKIIASESQKFGKLIYIVSDEYVQKKVTFINTKGKKVYSKTTIGSPIYLSKLEKGTYTVKIKEGSKTETKQFLIN